MPYSFLSQVIKVLLFETVATDILIFNEKNENIVDFDKSWESEKFKNWKVEAR